MNQTSNNLEKIKNQISMLCPYVLDNVLRKFTSDGGGVSFTISFENMKIDMPSITDSKGHQIGSGSVTMNGSIKMSAELYEKKS